MSTMKSCWTIASYFYHQYLYIKMIGFFLWLIVSSMIFISTTQGMLVQATTGEIVTYMMSAQVLGLLITLVTLFIPRSVLRIPLVFELFNQKH